MAYANFKPIVWSKYIQHELPKFTVFEKDCDYKFDGEAKKGKTVKILGVARPTVGDYDGTSIGNPEIIPDSAVLLPIDQAKYFNFMVDDVDEAQSREGLMPALMEESTRAMAEERDKYIARLCADGCGTASASTAITSKATAKTAVDAAMETLFSKGVSVPRDNVTIYLTPKVWMYMADYIIETRTSNDDALQRGKVPMYMGAEVKMSNDFYNDGTDDHLIVKTGKAVAFCGGIDEVEAYRPQGYFSDAVKGLNTYGGKVVRPKELYIIKAH